MEKNRWFWPLATVVIFFALGWYLSFRNYDQAHKKEVLATSQQMLCQFNQITEANKVTMSLLNDKKDLLEAKHDLGEDTFSMLGGDKKLAITEKAIFLSKLYTQAQEMIYNGMAQTADPMVFELGFPTHIGNQDIEVSDAV